MENKKDFIEVWSENKIIHTCKIDKLDDYFKKLKSEYKSLGYTMIYSHSGGSSGHLLFGNVKKQHSFYVLWKENTGYTDIDDNPIYYDDNVKVVDESFGFFGEESNIYSHWRSNEGLGIYLRFGRNWSSYLESHTDVTIMSADDFKKLRKTKDIFEKFID